MEKRFGIFQIKILIIYHANEHNPAGRTGVNTCGERRLRSSTESADVPYVAVKNDREPSDFDKLKG